MYSKTGKHTSLTTLRVETFKLSSDNDLRKLPQVAKPYFSTLKEHVIKLGTCGMNHLKTWIYLIHPIGDGPQMNGKLKIDVEIFITATATATANVPN